MQEMHKFDPPISEIGRKCCPVCKKSFSYFFLKRMLPESKIVLGYGIAWDNVITSIADILKYSLVLTAAKGLGSVPSARPCPVRKIDFAPQ